ncbi:MAG: amino acid adenylation domain-containing protein [Bacteroidota bacterium]
MITLLHHTIEIGASRFPEKEAFKCGAKTITFGDLHLLTNQLAALLIDQGVEKGDRVGVNMNRSLESAIAIYGIMKAGAVYVPLDPHAPASRTRFLIEDCEIRVLIANPTQKRGLHVLFEAPTGLKTLIGCNGEWNIDVFSWDDVSNFPNSFKRPELNENDLAYIMYTSGSTGTPKGIMHTHFSGLSYARLSAALYNLTENDVIGNHAPLHFDISTLGYFTAPLTCATSVIVPDAHTKMPASLTQLMEKEKMTIWYSVPLALIQMLTRGVLDQRDLTSLRWVLYGGEPFPVKHLKAIMQLWPQATFSNVYGPAEVNQCTYYNFKTLPEEIESIPLGTVWDQTQMMIVDQNDQMVAVNEPGELLIATITMMKGYWKQPDLTNRSILHFENTNGQIERYYRTGDLVKLQPDGNMLFLGRKDRQIKTRGYRVELDEVEAVLVMHEGVEEAAVFPVRINDEGQLIESAVILKAGSAISEEELKAHMSNHLPWYAIPRKIIISQSLPRTTSGKINRLLLQEQRSKLQKE